MADNNKIKVLIADDMEPIRRFYTRILDQTEDIEVVASVGSGKEATEEALRTKPDVVLMDIEMETSDAGIRASGDILAQLPDTKIIILTVYEEDELISAAFRFGAQGYLLKNSKPEEISAAVREAIKNGAPMSPEITSKVVNVYKRVDAYETSLLLAVDLLSGLTETELETLRLLMQGKTRREICEIRHVEISTVKSQIHQILRKFEKESICDVIGMLNELKLDDLISKMLQKKDPGYL
ncbi:MAG: response regulator transcription factor [Lachnospiraceae bacterium]|nr:response regulator transcription factor [Lachnospiraceae bacterium]